MKNLSNKSFAECILESIDQEMSKNKNVILFGEGIDDPPQCLELPKVLKRNTEIIEHLKCHYLKTVLWVLLLDLV